MSEHGDVLRALVADEQAGERELAPADDPTIRAHLRFAAVALTATAGDLAERLDGFADELPEWFTESQPLYEDHLATGVGAIALEEHLQFGTRPGADPSLDAGPPPAPAHRRRGSASSWWGWSAGWGPRRTASPTRRWPRWGTAGRDLSRLILSFDTAAKAAAPGRGRRGPGGPRDPGRDRPGRGRPGPRAADARGGDRGPDPRRLSRTGGRIPLSGGFPCRCSCRPTRATRGSGWARWWRRPPRIPSPR